ncbi:unnamed protein product [Didymodactylos carnosus]|uniref:Uncharacterized protein n=1 Tax=Didymodactylos carnosus TaxID=1234261 RepID=A0A814FDZ8_9BILA|nr:unnamed protein product [Didymodactylos carnosus]CAF3752680.1 unnamed protein product [Didymodactylos carnosus]
MEKLTLSVLKSKTNLKEDVRYNLADQRSSNNDEKYENLPVHPSSELTTDEIEKKYGKLMLDNDKNDPFSLEMVTSMILKRSHLRQEHLQVMYDEQKLKKKHQQYQQPSTVDSPRENLVKNTYKEDTFNEYKCKLERKITEKCNKSFER